MVKLNSIQRNIIPNLNFEFIVYNPNPNIETRNRVRSLGTYSESKKYVATLLVVRHFWIC